MTFTQLCWLNHSLRSLPSRSRAGSILVFTMWTWFGAGMYQRRCLKWISVKYSVQGPLTYLPKSWASAALAADAHTPPTCQHTIHFSRHRCQVRKMSDELSLTNIFTCHFPDKDRAPTSLEGLGEGKYCRHWSDNCFSERCASMTTVLMLNLSRRAEPCHYSVSINTVTMTFAKRWWNPKDPNTRKVWNERFVTVQDKAV